MFSYIKYVRAISDAGSFSEAAKSLYITQPCLSAMIKKAETQLGIKLFDRTSKPLQLTDLGRQYLEYYDKVQSIEREFENYLSDVRGLQTGSLYIGTNNVFASYVLPPLIRHFNNLYPGVRVHMIEGNVRYLSEALAQGRLDFVIDNCPMDTEEFFQEKIGDEQLLLAAHRSVVEAESIPDTFLTYHQIICGTHLNENTPSVPIISFAHLPFILLRAGNDTRIRVDSIFAEARKTAVPQLEVDQLATAYNIACNQLGITLVSDTLIYNATPNDDMKYYKLDSSHTKRAIYIYSKLRKYQTSAMQAFLTVARTYVPQKILFNKKT